MQHVVCLSIFVCLHSCSSSMSVIYQQHKDEDGFVYMAYSGENSMGWIHMKFPFRCWLWEQSVLKYISLVNCFCFAVFFTIYSSCALIPVFNLTQWLTYRLTMCTSIFYIIRTVVWRWLLIPHQNIFLHVLKPEVGIHEVALPNCKQRGLIPRLLRPGMKWRLGPMVHTLHQEHIKSTSGHYCPWSMAVTMMTLCIFGNWSWYPRACRINN